MNNRKRLVVLGGGESGVGAAILGKDKGMEVFLSDFGQIPERYRQQLEAEGIEWEQGQHTLERILSADEVVKSPGIPPTAPVMKAIAEKGIPVISEIEMAGRFTDAKMVCITGSNGKTTTTLLTYHILREAGINVGLAGNVGRSLALQVARTPHDVYVIELSSFQLENMYEFKANIAVMLNITPDHLDRYDYKMDNYVKAKFRIIRNLTSEDAFIFWQDDPTIQRQLEQIATEARLFPFAEHEEHQSHAWVDDAGELVFDTSETSLKMPRAFAQRPPQPIQFDGCRSVGLPARHKKRGYTPRPVGLRRSGAPPRTGRNSRRRALYQRLQSHQRQFMLVCA